MCHLFTQYPHLTHRQMEEQILWWLSVSHSADVAWHSVLREAYWRRLLWILIPFIKTGQTLFNPVTLPPSLKTHYRAVCPNWESTSFLQAKIPALMHVCSSDCRAYFVNQEVLRLCKAETGGLLVDWLKSEGCHSLKPAVERTRWSNQMLKHGLSPYIWCSLTLQIYMVLER